MSEAKKKYSKTETPQVFDLLFKQLLHLSNKAVVSFINGLFGTKHALDSVVEYLNTETVNKKMQRRNRDTMIRINNKTYHVEAQISFDRDMMIRVFEYGFAYGVWEKTKDGDIRTIELPQVRIIYWELAGKEPVRQILRLKFPDGFIYDYSVKTFNLLSRKIAELEKKGLAILIPFYVLKMRKQVKEAKDGAERQKLSKPMLKLFNELSATVDRCKERKIIGEEDAASILNGLQRLYIELFSQYKELAEVDSMLKDKVIETGWDIAEKKAIEIAKNFLAKGISPEIVAESAGLPLKKVKSLQKSVLKTKKQLVLA